MGQEFASLTPSAQLQVWNRWVGAGQVLAAGRTQQLLWSLLRAGPLGGPAGACAQSRLCWETFLGRHQQGPQNGSYLRSTGNKSRSNSKSFPLYGSLPFTKRPPLERVKRTVSAT